MNLHVTSDSYGLYSVEIAKRIKNSANSRNNQIVNLLKTSVYKDSTITYIPATSVAFKNYISKFVHLDKIIFHPYNSTGYSFLKNVIKKFPDVKVYWMCWSYELYEPHLIPNFYEAFSANYLKRKNFFSKILKDPLKKSVYKILNISGIRKDYKIILRHQYSLIHYFCSPFYSDFLFLQKFVPQNKIKYLPVAYLSLNNIMPDLDKFYTLGNKIMIGHAASADGNHYEILCKLNTINPGYPVFLPLSYGDKQYAKLIKMEAQKKFINPEVLEKKLDPDNYYQKLTEVGWAIINVKVQQAVGNIIALVWMGSKVFLDKNTSTYKDFLSWGINVFNIQEHLNKYELANKLNPEQINNNKKLILEKFNEETISKGWNEFLY